MGGSREGDYFWRLPVGEEQNGLVHILNDATHMNTVFIQKGKDDLNWWRIGARQACTATVEPMARMWRGRDLEIRKLSIINFIEEGGGSPQVRISKVQKHVKIMQGRA